MTCKPCTTTKLKQPKIKQYIIRQKCAAINNFKYMLWGGGLCCGCEPISDSLANT